MKITKTQVGVLKKMRVDVYYSAYELVASLATMYALENKKLLIRKPTEFGCGSIFDPRVAIEFRLRKYKDGRIISPIYLND